MFALSIVFVFLILAALYESWSLPFSVLLSVPIAVFGAFLGLFIRGYRLRRLRPDRPRHADRPGGQERHPDRRVREGRGSTTARISSTAALEGARLRLRPILMTSFAFILGCVPLWMASGSGAASRRILGTVVITGMLAATLLAIFLIPMLFVLVERLRGHRSRGAAPRRRPGARRRRAVDDALDDRSSPRHGSAQF